MTYRRIERLKRAYLKPRRKVSTGGVIAVILSAVFFILILLFLSSCEKLPDPVQPVYCWSCLWIVGNDTIKMNQICMTESQIRLMERDSTYGLKKMTCIKK